MREAKIREFADGYKPSGKVVELEKQPVVLRFPPSAYRMLEPEELKEWHEEIRDRLGLDFDIGGGSGGTVTFCQRGGTGAAYRCDSDAQASAKLDVESEEGKRLLPWDSTPLILDFPPVAYEVLEPDRLKEWAADLKERFGLDFDIGGGSGGTISFCQRGGSGAAYRCDSDIG